MKRNSSVILMVVAVLCAAALGGAPLRAAAEGAVKIDGSSTVYPITEAVAEEYLKVDPKVKVTVGISGTGGGFKKFCVNELDIADASRPIKQAEIDACAAAGVEYVELPVAYDALSVVVNKKNSWAESMTVAELKKIWEPEAQGKILRWNQIRSDWPDKPMALFGAGVDSGTYDYFTEVIVGKEHSSRGDFTSSEDDNVLVQGVAGDQFSLGFFGMAYYHENADKLKAVKIDDGDRSNGDGPQAPTVENVQKGVYRPLARPLYIYVAKKSLERPAVKAFADFYLNNAAKLSEEVGYVQVPVEVAQLAKARLDGKVTGSVYAKPGAKAAKSLAELMK